MNCEKYQELTIVERRELIGKIVHLMQCDSQFFDSITSIIRAAEQVGKLDNVKFLNNDTNFQVEV